MATKYSIQYMLIVVCLCLCVMGYAQTAQRPNIIFILTDDQRWDALGAAGNPIIKTPNMDNLVQEGVYFKNAFATTPICAASRASLLTGMYERTHEFTFQQGNLKDPYIDIAYPNYLRQQGYYTGFFGKMGVFFKDPARLFDQAEIYDREDKLPDYRGYNYKSIDGDSVHLTTYTSYQAQNFIENAPQDKPFYLAVNFSAPHAHDPSVEQFYWDRQFDHLYEDIRIPQAVLSSDSYFESLPTAVQEGFNRTRWKWRFDTDEKFQRSIKGYYRMISQIDYEIGNIRKALKERGIEGNTVIIFSSDNGFFLGDRQLADKWLMYDTSIRVPLVVYDPRYRHKEIKDMVLNIDIPSTILDLANIIPPKVYQGQRLTDYYMPNRKAVARKAILTEHLWDKKEIPSSEGIRTVRWKYFRYRLIDAPEELYDLKKDPQEKNNLADNPKYKKIKIELRQELERQAATYAAKKLTDSQNMDGKR